MPANLPPQYFEAEKRYRLAKSAQEKVEALEAMLSIMPKHKGTDKLRAELRRKIAKFSQEAQRRHIIGRKGAGYHIRREGAGQVILVGLPNVGKSQLVSAVTNASPDVADYPFTTKNPTPGMMKFENIQIQLVDIPPITDPGAESWLPSILRNADALLLVVDLGDDPVSQAETVIQELAKVRIKPVGRGEGGDRWLIEKRALIAANKNDLDGSAEKYKGLGLKYGGRFPLVSISARDGIGLEEMKAEVFRMLDIIRVYTKAPGRKPDLDEPVILRRGSTVEDVAESIHKDFRTRLKYALVWGSGRFEGQRVKREHVLEDGDVVELHV